MTLAVFGLSAGGGFLVGWGAMRSLVGTMREEIGKLRETVSLLAKVEERVDGHSREIAELRTGLAETRKEIGDLRVALARLQGVD